MKCLCCGKDFMPKVITQKYCCRRCGRKYIRTDRKKLEKNNVKNPVSYQTKLNCFQIKELEFENKNIKAENENLNLEIKNLKREINKLKSTIYSINILTEHQIAGGAKCQKVNN